MIPVNYVKLVFMLLYGKRIVNTAVFLTFEPDVICIGETLFLICTVDDVDMIDQELVRQWTKGPDLICHNGHSIDPIKYRETVTKQNQFKLQIINVTESDLRCKYQCRYSFETQTKMMEISEHNFEYPPANDTKALIHKNVTDENITIQLHLKKVYPLPICTVIIGDSRIPLDIVKHLKCNIFNEVYMVKRLPIKCIDNLEVTCQVIKNYSIAVEDRETCKPDGNSKMKIALLVGLPFLVIFLVIGLLIMNAVRKKGNLRETGEDVELNQEPFLSSGAELQVKSEPPV